MSKARGKIEAQFFDAVLEGLPIGILFLDGAQIVQANSFAAGLFGYALNEFIGMSMWDVYPSREAYRELVRDCLPVIQAGGIYRSTGNYKFRDGRLFWVHTAGRLIDVSRPKQSLWIVEDITTEHRMTEALERSAREMTTIFNNASIGIAVLKGPLITRCNRRFEEILGVTPGAMLGKTSQILYD